MLTVLTTDCDLQNGQEGSSSGVGECRNNCCNLGTNVTVTCTESNMSCEPCVCQSIREYLKPRNITDVQMQCSQQLCAVSCNEGFIGDNVTYMCNDSNCTLACDQEITCERGL